MLMQQIERLRLLWGRLSQNQKIGVIFVGMTAIVAVALLVLLRPPQNYETAFSGLTSEDAAAIVEQLRAGGIPYELSSDGTTIRVPAANVAEVRLSAASSGLPKGGGVGFELFDKSSFGITEFAQQVNYQRALEGELQRTINQIESVSSSRVHIVIPEETLFTDEQQPTTAAVVLGLKPGGRLSDAQIKGITHLVASSVPGLDPANLTVVDTAGTPIWSGEEESSLYAGADDNFAMQQAYERDLARELETMIGQVVGSGQAAVSVNADLNWDETTTESEIYSPDGTQGQIRSQSETTSESTGTTSTTGGAPGTDANTDTYQATDGTAGGSSSSTTRDITTNYELSRTVTQTVKAPGSVDRLSVAVVLNGDEVDPVVAQEIQNLVTAAAGIVPDRGDTVTVSSVPFSAPVEDVAASGGSILDRVLPILKIVGMILVPLFGLLIARRVLLGNKPEMLPATIPPQYYQPAPVQATAAAAGAYGQHTHRISMTEVPDEEPQPRFPQLNEVRGKSIAQQQVQELAENDPGQIAAMIRSWMTEESK